MQLEQKTALTAGIMLLASGAAGAATVSGFDDLALAPESYHAGVTGALYTPNTTSFTSGPATYYNEATDWGVAPPGRVGPTPTPPTRARPAT